MEYRPNINYQPFITWAGWSSHPVYRHFLHDQVYGILGDTHLPDTAQKPWLASAPVPQALWGLLEAKTKHPKVIVSRTSTPPRWLMALPDPRLGLNKLRGSLEDLRISSFIQ